VVNQFFFERGGYFLKKLHFFGFAVLLLLLFLSVTLQSHAITALSEASAINHNGDFAIDDTSVTTLDYTLEQGTGSSRAAPLPNTLTTSSTMAKIRPPESTGRTFDNNRHVTTMSNAATLAKKANQQQESSDNNIPLQSSGFTVALITVSPQAEEVRYPLKTSINALNIAGTTVPPGSIQHSKHAAPYERSGNLVGNNNNIIGLVVFSN
jgi:hypothetical protein